jgi:exodeoxyribonuclease V alpha subunit
MDESRDLAEDELFSPLDTHFARFMQRLAGESCPELSLAAALLSRATREGHICLDLSAPQMLRGGGGPTLEGWSAKLRQSRVVGRIGDHKPLILDDKGRLYLYRYWEYEKKLADAVKERVSGDGRRVDPSLLRRRLSQLFPHENSEETDWQEIAAATAALRPFCVISGGPGTGKTTTVAKILALLLEQNHQARLRIALLCPTGKGASRLQEAIRRAKEALPCDEDIRARIPEEASTLHRFLGGRGDSPYFRWNEENKVGVDIVVVDEASMVDLPLMSKLIQALPSETRLILLGDKDQLASVEAGAVLGDICDTGRSHGFSRSFSKTVRHITGCDVGLGSENGAPVMDSIVQLRKSYRFAMESGIAVLGRFVNEGKGEEALALMKEKKFPDTGWTRLANPSSLRQAMIGRVVREYRDMAGNPDPDAVFGLMETFRVLCALREGPYGVVAVNRIIETILRQEALTEENAKWYKGRPVLITRNDYNLRLYNGDVGVALPDPASGGDLRVFFSSPDGCFRKFHPLRLPEHETVYAMTVHKSQGSEFDEIVMVLPDRDSPVMTRELIYTGITRARKRVRILGDERVFCTAVSRRIERRSGLRDALWDNP